MGIKKEEPEDDSANTFTCDRVRAFLLAVLPQLAQLHAQGVVHRCMSVDNIYKVGNEYWITDIGASGAAIRSSACKNCGRDAVIYCGECRCLLCDACSSQVHSMPIFQGHTLLSAAEMPGYNAEIWHPSQAHIPRSNFKKIGEDDFQKNLAAHAREHSGAPPAPQVDHSKDAYRAPEQVEGKACFASDIYSLGMSCWYLLGGIPAPPRYKHNGDALDEWVLALWEEKDKLYLDNK